MKRTNTHAARGLERPSRLWSLSDAFRGISWVAAALLFLATIAGASPQTRAAGAAPSFPVGVGHEFKDCADCPTMIVVPAGKFMMGSPDAEKGRFLNEGPQHLVVVSHPFAIAKYPLAMGDLRKWRPGRGPDPIDEDPAVMVNWFDAQAYAAWLSRKAGKIYHLPTEAEYEYAERAGTTTPYYWGDEIGAGHANCFGCKSFWDGKGASPVGTFAPNAFGLYDMTGDVFEWAADCYVESEAGAPADAFVARIADPCKWRTLRGGSWLNLPSFLRSAYRFNEAPNNKNARRGFRLVRD